ncbi:MAG TPA: type II toxin-antitoxin system HicA family toxin [Thermoanaerobaculia bacterium]|nr:type II toxin-antitoxin system HicA family toxin [Thermoanaerobaculia bacterium]
MNRRDLIRELTREGCHLERHGSRHDIYVNPANGRKAPIPRHNEIKNSLADLIRKQLGIRGK